MKESIFFYTNGLGMKLIQKPQKFRPTGGQFAYLRSNNSSQTIELNWYPGSYVSGYESGDELDHLGFWLNKSDDMQALVDRLVKMGAKIAIAPYVEGRTRLAFVTDINGIWIEFLQRVSKGTNVKS